MTSHSERLMMWLYGLHMSECTRDLLPDLDWGPGELLWDAMILPGMLCCIHDEQGGHTLSTHEARVQSQPQHQMV